MKKIDLILKGKKLVEKLFGLRKKQISRVIESAKDNLEKQKVEAELEYENLSNKLGDDDANYEYIINQMIKQKEIIANATETLKAVESIESDLDEEVEYVEEDN